MISIESRRRSSRSLLVPAVRLFGVIVVIVALGLPLTASAAPQPAWKCLSAVCVGTSRAEIEYRFGRSDKRLYFSVKVPGGRVWLAFFKEVDAVALDHVTAVNRVTKVETCDPIFRLPDGVVKGTMIPFGKRWHGYKFGYGGEPYGPIWQKWVRVGSMTVRVRLSIEKARVTCVGLSRISG